MYIYIYIFSSDSPPARRQAIHGGKTLSASTNDPSDSHSVAPTRLYIFLLTGGRDPFRVIPLIGQAFQAISRPSEIGRWGGGDAHISTPRPGSRAAICCIGSPLAERWQMCSHPSDWLRGALCPYLERNPRCQCPKKPRLAHWTLPTAVLDTHVHGKGRW